MLEKIYRPAEVEARLYSVWEQSGTFSRSLEAKAAPYTIMMPPPNITGTLHMGHALTYILQDVLIRYRRAQGRDTLWQPGIDHAGIATQMVVERQLDAVGQTRQALGREAFIAKIWQWKQDSSGMITRQLRRLGALPDWSRERFTMDDGLSEAVRKVFVALYRKGLIYRDKRLVNWDPKLHTAISDLEVEQKEVAGSLWYIDYPIEGEPGRCITVATTRPETMLGDTGIAVHPEDERWRGLIGKKAILPLVGRAIPIVADNYCDPDKGSGAVKITPAHDFNDFEVARRHQLELINIFDRDAKSNDAVPPIYRSLERFELRKRIVNDLAAVGALAKIEPYSHMVPHGDRSGVAIEPWLTDQWYCDALTLAKPAIEAVEQGRIAFVPEQWRNTYFQWMRAIQPWCISRQLWWGHQIPAWYGPDGQVFVAHDEEEAQQQAQRHYGTPTDLRRDEDVLDTWFSSALWPFSTLGWPKQTPELARYYPTDVLVTGFDIIFFWVARMIMMGLEFMGDVPFRTVYIHALVRDERGQKMSKSKGNVIDPQALIDEYGCDALRFTLTAMAAPGRDVKLSKSRVEGYRNFATKLWNACRYAEMNACTFDVAYRPDRAQAPVNRWIVGALSDLSAKMVVALDGYRFNDAANLLYHFVWGSFCDWYLEFTKPILTGGDAVLAKETQATTAWAIEKILRLMHPIMPFMTEELWHSLGYGQEGSLAKKAHWPDFSPDLTDVQIRAEMEWVIGVISQIRALRSEMNIAPQARLPLYCGQMNGQTALWLETHRESLVRLARLSAIETQSVADGAVSLFQGDATLLLGVSGAVDVKAETARLSKELAKLEREIVRYESKLSNVDFRAKASSTVIEDTVEGRGEAVATRDRLQAALSRLAGL